MTHIPRITRTTIALCSLLSCSTLSRAEEVSNSQAWPVPEYEAGNYSSNRHLPDLDTDPTLSDYLTYAALNNPELEASFNKWKASLEKISQVDALPDPKFTYAYFIEQVETRVGPQVQKFGLSQMFPWFGKLSLRSDIAAEAANADFQRYQAVKFSVFYRVKKSYYEYSYLQRAISVTEDNIELLKHLESVAQSKYKTGGSQIGVIKAQVELGKLDDRIRTLQELRGPISARLNAALNRPQESALPWPQNAPLSGAKVVDDEMFDQLSNANPQLLALDNLIKKEEQAIVLARREYYPDFMIGVDYIDTDEALMEGTLDSGKDPVVAMIAIDIPLWRGKYKAGVKEAKFRKEAVTQMRSNQGNQLEADLKMALYRFRDAERKIDLYGDTLVPQANQSLSVTEEAYRAGAADFLNLIDAERLLLEFQLSHERSLVDREIALAEIEKLIGKPLGTWTTD